MRVLIVDDSRTMRGSLTAVVQELELETEQAADGEEALECMSANYFDLVLVDWDMQSMDGLSFIQTVQREPCYDSVKLMMLTSKNSIDAVCEAINQGAADYLMKPITADMLADKLEPFGIVN